MVDCLRITGACWRLPGPLAHGLGSRDEHVELSGDLETIIVMKFHHFYAFIFTLNVRTRWVMYLVGRAAIEVDCLLSLDCLLCRIGLISLLSADRSGLK